MTDPSLKCVVWRGALKLAENGHLPSEIYPGFQLRLDVLESEIILEESVSTNSEDLEPNLHGKPSCTRHNFCLLWDHHPISVPVLTDSYLILSPTLSMVDECSFTSIPPYIFANAAFRLLITEPNMFNEKSSKFLDYLENKKGAVIAQMGYSILMKKPKSDEFLNTNKWQKAISSGNIRLPEICLPIVDKCITFAITHSSKTGNIIAYPLRDTASLNAELVFLLTDNLNSKQDLNSSDSCDSDSDQALNCADLKFPHLSETVFYFLMNKINFLKMNKKENFNSEDLHSCLLSIQEHASEQLASCSLFENVNLYDILHDEIDPADWPERVHLLQKQMLIDDDKTNVLPKFLHTPSPQVQNNVCFTSEDADKYFHSSGEAKTSANAELISRLNKTLKPANVDYDNVLQSKWPEAIDLIYPDLYYNVDKQVEEKESVGNDMVRLYVQHETATTCNKQQVYPNAPIFVRTGTAAVKTVRKMKWRSPSKQILLPKKSLNLVYKTYVDSKRASVSNSKSSASVDPDAKSAKIEKPFKKQLKKPALPVRCSPRKKQPVVYSEVASRNSQTTQQKQSNSSDAAEIFKSFSALFQKAFYNLSSFCARHPSQKGSTSEHMQKIADAHVKQVIQFEKQK
ncbi:MTBP_C domain-containing protein [Caerostris extrusa]|uniref:MTBP_C domain-containing protein n=1 Tax=Caerostris extrusa TaxID=172846 RepID=A0AAV4QTX7_CAEEX|nr:MTBP_C domain-containing protein [Caerostris extrusa]